MQLQFEQLFYGRGAGGYGILAASPNGASFAHHVESLCGSIGTSGADYGGEPFVFSVPEAEWVIMVCGRRGAFDGMGRSTLFFHALVGKKSDLSAANADAFTLFELGLFADNISSQTISSLIVQVDHNSRLSTGSLQNRCSLPCVIRSDKPANDLVGTIVRGHENDISWATLTFQYIPNFDVQVLSSSVSIPRMVNEYDAKGQLIHTAKFTLSDEVELHRQRSVAHQSAPQSSPEHPKFSAMLKVSLFFNFLFLTIFVMFFLSGKTTQINTIPTQKVVTNTVVKTIEVDVSPRRIVEIENAAREEYRKRLLSSAPSLDFRELPGFKSVANWKDEVEDDRRKAFSMLIKMEDLIKELNKYNNEEHNL